MSTADDDSSNRRCALLPVQYQASRKCDLAILQFSTAEPGCWQRPLNHWERASAMNYTRFTESLSETTTEYQRCGIALRLIFLLSIYWIAACLSGPPSSMIMNKWIIIKKIEGSWRFCNLCSQYILLETQHHVLVPKIPSYFFLIYVQLKMMSYKRR